MPLDLLGVGLWVEGLGDWARVAASWRGEDLPEGEAPLKPQALLLPPPERRRAPATVAVAMDVADQACRMAGVPAASLRSVFCSALGDMAITDYLCRTLVESPEHLSPIKFHHSVHNAAAGYWTMAVGNHAASSSMAAGGHSFAQALLEAAAQVPCEGQPTLLVAYDMASPEPLGEVTGSHVLAGLALVLAPPSASPSNSSLADPAARPLPRPLAHLSVSLVEGGAASLVEAPALANPPAQAWPLLRALAAPGADQGRGPGPAQTVPLRLSATLSLAVTVASTGSALS
jgi:hypothetical protein